MTKGQSKLIQQMSDREIIIHLYLTQFFLLIIAGIGSLFLFSSFDDFLSIWEGDIDEIFFFGAGSALIVIIFDLLLMKYLPEEMYSDGGINEKVFQRRTIFHILILTLVVAFTEELLFRGLIQTHFGFVFASIIFALLHLRYLVKWVLLVTVFGLSFFMGWMFHITENLWVTTLSHFLIDFIFALIIRGNYLKDLSSEKEGDIFEERQ